MLGSPWASSPVVVRLQVPPRGAPALYWGQLALLNCLRQAWGEE